MAIHHTSVSDEGTGHDSVPYRELLALLAQRSLDGVQVVAKANVVLDLHYLLAAVTARHQHTATRRVLAPAAAAADVPRVADHQLEVIIVVDGR